MSVKMAKESLIVWQLVICCDNYNAYAAEVVQ